MTIWIPETLEERLANLGEAVAIADRLGDPWLQFHAVHWHSVGLVQAGLIDRAEAAIGRQSELAERIRDPTMLWISTYDRANVAIVAGRLEEAESLAQQAAKIADESGQPDALPFLASQLTNIRYEQGRLAELQPLIAEVVAGNPGIPAFRAVLALAYIEGDLRQEASALLELDLADEFAQMPADVTWLASHVIYAQVAADLGNRDAAAVLRDRLAPFADQIVYTGISVWGDVDHVVGRLAAVLKRPEEAERHLRRSNERFREIGAPVCLARGELHLARLLLDRDGPGDRAEAEALLESAGSAARRLGAATIERRARSLSDHLRAIELVATAGRTGRRLRIGAEEAAPAGDRPAPPGSLEQSGDYWTLRCSEREVRLKDSKGLHYLAALLAHPGVDLHAADLQAGAPARPARGGPDPDLGARRLGSEDAGPVLDEAAKREYRDRIEQLEQEIEEADRFNDPERAANARRELEFVTTELAAAVGIGGRDRKAASQAERARVNVTRALRKVADRIAQHDETLGGHFSSSLRTGTFCRYEPPPGQRIEWEVRGAGV